MTRRASGPSSLVVVLGLITACSGATDPTAADAGGAVDPTASGDGDASVASSSSDLVPAFESAGFTVANGKFEVLDLSTCCASSCAGNNPSSPYATLLVPRGPGQTAPNPSERDDGLSPTFRLRADEAVVFVGKTPPPSAYFGFTPYLHDRAKDDGERRLVAASLSETLNNAVIGVEGGGDPFSKRTVVVAAADAATVEAAKAAVVASGIPSSAVNVLVFDPTIGRFGVEDAADAFGVLFRNAVPKDPAARDAYLKDPGASVYRLTPRTPSSPRPLPAPAARPKDATNTEVALEGAVDDLGAAIQAAHPAFEAEPISVNEGASDPAKCIEGRAVCAYDNRDTNYPSTPPRLLFTSDDDFYVVYGVNHQATGKVSYANASVYALEKLVGIISVTSDRWAGSAQKYAPQSADAPKLYAWKLARKCNGEPFCTEVPKGGCPTGIDNGKLGTLTFRTYLEPGTHTAPAPATLVRDRVLRFRKP